MPLTYSLLALAILIEVMATLALRMSHGFTKLLPAGVAVGGYLAAVMLLAIVLKRGLPVSMAYAIWAGAGVALVAVAGVFVFREALTLVQVGGLVLIVVGVLAMEGGSPH